MNRRLMTVAALGVAVALAIPAAAQFAGPPEPGGGFRLAQFDGGGWGPPQDMGPGRGRHGGWHHGRGPGKGGPGHGFQRICRNVEAKVAGRLAFVEVALKLTDDQQPAWERLVAAVNEAVIPVKAACDDIGGQGRPATLPERLERMETMAATHLSVLQTVRPAIDDLFAHLTPEQQQTVNRMGMRGRRF